MNAPRRVWRTRVAASLASLAFVSSVARVHPALALDPPRVIVPGADTLPRYALDPLDLSRASPRPEVRLYEARGTAERGIVTSCVALAASGWVDEAEPVAFEKLAGIAAATVTRARGRPPAWHEVPVDRAAFPLRRVLVPDTPDTAEASLVLGFVSDEGHEALACFAVSYGGAPAARDARVEAPFVAPPRPGLGLGALVWSVHHPREVLGGLASCAALFAFFYLRARPRPRARRIRSTRGT